MPDKWDQFSSSQGVSSRNWDQFASGPIVPPPPAHPGPHTINPASTVQPLDMGNPMNLVGKSDFAPMPSSILGPGMTFGRDALLTLIGGAGSPGVREAGPTVAKVGRGAVKGGTQAFIEGKSSVPAATGALIGHAIHGPQGAEIGAGLGALPGTVQGIIQGIRSEFAPPAVERPGMAPPAVKFKSGQTPVAPPPVSFPAGPEATSPWAAPPVSFPPVSPAARPMPAPPISFPAGPEAESPWAAPPVSFPKPVAAAPAKSVAPPPVSFRQPPAPGKVVPPPPVTFKPVEEGSYPPITIEGIGPVRPLGPPPKPTEESPFMTNENLMPIDKVELNRMLHAKAQRLNLPNSPAGQRAPGLMTTEAQKVFGKSYDQLTVPELKQLYTHLDTLQVK